MPTLFSKRRTRFIDHILTSQNTRRILFLSWESPWPAYSGAALRTDGILREISKYFNVELLLLTRQPLSPDQVNYLSNFVEDITRIPLKDVSLRDKIKVVTLMFWKGTPYHSAILEISLQKHPETRKKINNFQGIVFTNLGHWGMLVRSKPAKNWVLNQCDADVDFWRVYGKNTSNPLIWLFAKINYALSKRQFPSIYSHVGHIISVSKEDKNLTQLLSPNSNISIIENGVDCDYFSPAKNNNMTDKRLLFTGTSAHRNIVALRYFLKEVYPLVQKELPDIELLVAGNFHLEAQKEFQDYSSVSFTGKINDIRPAYNKSDVFVAPFKDVHGSKLKISQAMAMEMAIVSTEQGIRGFPLVDGESVLIAKDDKQFANHIITLLKNPELGKSLGFKARHIALTSLDWKVIGRKLVEIIYNVSDESKYV